MNPLTPKSQSPNVVAMPAQIRAAQPIPPPSVRVERGAIVLSDGEAEVAITVRDLINQGTIQDRLLFAQIMLMADSVSSAKAVAQQTNPEALLGNILGMLQRIGMQIPEVPKPE